MKEEPFDLMDLQESDQNPDQLELIGREEMTTEGDDTQDAPPDNKVEAWEDRQEVPETHVCTFCGRNVNPDDDVTHKEVRSWVSGAKKDSAVLREYTGRKACNPCIQGLRSGIGSSQQDLYELLDGPSVVSTATNIFTDRSKEYKAGYDDGHAGTPSNPPKVKKTSLNYHTATTDYKEGYADGRAARELATE